MQLLSVTLLLCTVCSIVYGEKESCEGLDKIDSYPLIDCDINENCLSIDCNVTGYPEHGAILILLPCNQPPALKLLVKSPDGTTSLGTFDSSEPSRTTSAALSTNAVFEITVSWPTTNIAKIESTVSVRSGENIFMQDLVEPTNVTIPECVPAATTCLALQQIAVDASEELSCNANGLEDCDTVVCTTFINNLPLISEFEILSCNDPPAIAVTITIGDSVIFEQVLDESQEIDLFSATLDVTLDQLDDALGLEVDFLEEGGMFNILSYTIIPIDKTKCVDDNKNDDELSDDESAASSMKSFGMMLTFSSLLYMLL